MEQNAFWRKLAEDMSNITSLPLVELAGTGRILIENHNGIAEYGDTAITIKMCYGCLAVQGQNLEILQITKHQLVITGTINALTILRRAG